MQELMQDKHMAVGSDKDNIISLLDVFVKYKAKVTNLVLKVAFRLSSKICSSIINFLNQSIKV